MSLWLNRQHAQYAVIFLAVLFVAIVSAVAITMILGLERGQQMNLQEHRQHNQSDHDAICLMLQDWARTEGRRVLPCGSDGRP